MLNAAASIRRQAAGIESSEAAQAVGKPLLGQGQSAGIRFGTLPDSYCVPVKP
jgi:hypothetical protein